MENWKEYVGYEGYYVVSDLGNVYSVDRWRNNRWGGYLQRGHPMTPQKDKQGYLNIGLSKNNKSKTYKIHRMVAEMFISNPENKQEVNHIEGNKEDNRASMLEWMTPKENTQDAWNKGLAVGKMGKQNGRSKLIDGQVIEISNKYKTGKYTSRQLGKEYGVSKTVILNIINLKSWPHLPR